MGAIRRTVPAECTAYTLGNSEIGVKGNQVSLPDGSWTFDVSDISTDNVKTVLGETTDDVYSLCHSDSINQNALFRPTYDNPLGVDLSEFAGYNHHAMPPTYFFNPQTYYNTIKNSSGVGVLGFSLAKGERLPSMDNSAHSWNRIKVKIVYGDANGSKTVWSSLGVVGGTFQVSMSDGTDPNTYTGCDVIAYYCDVNGNVLDEIEGGPHGSFTMKLDVYYYSYAITKGNECLVRHYYPYYNGGNKYDNYIEVPINQANSFGFDSITNPTKAIGLNFTNYSKVNSAGQTCPYGFSIMQGGSGKYFQFMLTSADQRQIGSKFKSNGTWYEVNSVYTSGAKEYITSFASVTGFM